MSDNLGYCRICGSYTELTDEHIPPKKAFNQKPVQFGTLQDLLGVTGRPYSKFRKGVVVRTLCEPCNNTTGDWYARDFINWTNQAYDWLNRMSPVDQLALPYQIKPLNVIKQIITMTLALSFEANLPFNSEIREFIYNRERKYLPPQIRVYTYFNPGYKTRISNYECVISKFDSSPFVGRSTYVHAEIAMPPLGYCIISTEERTNLAELAGLYDMTYFTKFNYNRWVEMYIKLPLRETNSQFPLDYRTKQEVADHNLKMKKRDQP